MKQTLIWATGGLVLGGIIHILALFAIPMFAANDSWARLIRIAPPNSFHFLAADGEMPLPDLDPSLRHAFCTYDLSEGPLRIDARIPLAYWSLALYDRHGMNYYALNDRLVAGREIELWVATPKQLLVMAPETPEAADRDDRLIIGAPQEQGFAIFRALVPEPSYAAMVEEALAQTNCATADPKSVGGGDGQ